MGEHNEQTLQCYLYCFVVLCSKQVEVVSYNVAILVESEDAFGVSWVSQIRENIANLSPHIIGISLKQFQ